MEICRACRSRCRDSCGGGSFNSSRSYGGEVLESTSPEYCFSIVLRPDVVRGDVREQRDAVDRQGGRAALLNSAALWQLGTSNRPRIMRTALCFSALWGYTERFAIGSPDDEDAERAPGGNYLSPRRSYMIQISVRCILHACQCSKDARCICSRGRGRRPGRAKRGGAGYPDTFPRCRSACGGHTRRCRLLSKAWLQAHTCSHQALEIVNT
jgi:hypothetical protein